MPDIAFRIYPTLLNQYIAYKAKEGIDSKKELLNRINRVSDFDTETLAKFRKGINFEAAVLKNTVHNFDPDVIKKIRALLPQQYVSQKLIKFNHGRAQFYGYADVVGESRVIDLKTTSTYKPDKYANNAQNLYLYGLLEHGFTSMEFLIYDFHSIKVEKYLQPDFQFLLTMLEDFCDFLDQHRSQIYDKKIFVSPTFDLFS